MIPLRDLEKEVWEKYPYLFFMIGNFQPYPFLYFVNLAICYERTDSVVVNFEEKILLFMGEKM